MAGRAQNANDRARATRGLPDGRRQLLDAQQRTHRALRRLIEIRTTILERMPAGVCAMIPLAHRTILRVGSARCRPPETRSPPPVFSWFAGMPSNDQQSIAAPARSAIDLMQRRGSGPIFRL